MQKQTSNCDSFVCNAEIEDLTLDVCVLMSGSGISDKTTCERYGRQSLDLMKKMVTEDKYRLAFDDRKKIRSQYDQKLAQSYGIYFIKEMVSREKTIDVHWRTINRGVRVEMETHGFTQNNEDYKYVIVASGTICKKLISHEPHFWSVQKPLKKLGISVILPDQG